MAILKWTPSTNLRSQLEELRHRLAEPFDPSQEGTSNPVEGYYPDQALLNFLHAAELMVAHDVVDDALLSLQTTFDITTANGTETYDLPQRSLTALGDPPILRLVAAELDRGWGRKYPCRLLPPEAFFRADFDPMFRASERSPVASLIDDGQIRVRPIPGAEAGATKLVLRYIRVPRRRFRHYKGIVDSSTTTIVTDGDMIQPASFWVTNAQCSLRIVTQNGILGEERMVTANDATTITVTPAFSEAPVAGDEYHIGEVSELSDELIPAVMAWATYLGYQADARGDHTIPLQEYKGFIQSINQRYAGIHGQEAKV